MTRTEASRQIVERAAQAAFGRPLVSNTLRSILVEAMVAQALEPEWTWCAADYASWDFERADKLRLEVKQSAARQTWAKDGRISTARFDIAARTGAWLNGAWAPGSRRNAHLYVLAHHVVTDDTTDHRERSQWLFYVVTAARLPNSATIGLAGLKALATPVRFDRLHNAVDVVACDAQANAA